MGAYRRGKMNNTTSNSTTNSITNIITYTELGQEQPNPQLVEHVIVAVRGVHCQDIAKQAPEVTPGFPPRCSSTNSASIAFVIFDHSHGPHKTSTINYQKPK
jgi:hypothetical protein